MERQRPRTTSWSPRWHCGAAGAHSIMEGMPSVPARKARTRLMAVCLAVVLAALLAAAEAWARQRTAHARLAGAFERGAYTRILILNPPGGSAEPARFTTNRWGMRGEDPPADWEAWDTWLALGSSTTLCLYQDDSLAWPARLQTRLRAARPRTWVGNAGVDGSTVVSLGALLDTVAREAAPKGLLILPGGPDMPHDLSDDRHGPNLFDEALFRRLSRLGDPPPGWRDRFGLGRLSHRRKTRFVPDSSGHRPWEPPALAAPEGPLPPLDSLLPSLPAYRASLGRMGALARALGMRAVFLTQPIGYGTDPAWAKREARVVSLRGRELHLSCATERRLRDAYNAALLAVCAADSLECFDLSARMSGEPRWFYDGSHFSDAGSERAAALIADYLLRAAPIRP